MREAERLSLVNRSAKSWIRNAECSDRQNKLIKPLLGFRGMPFPSPSERCVHLHFSWKRTSKADRRNDHRAATYDRNIPETYDVLHILYIYFS